MKISNGDAQYKKMTETPVPNLIMKLAIPTIISMLITNLYNMVDTYYVSKLGTSASGAVGIVFGLMAILQAFGFMFGHGAGSNISRQLGKRDVESASIYASTSFFGSFAIGGIIGILGILFLNPLMRGLGSTETILPYARQYGVFILIAGPFMASSCVMNNILRYEGRAAYAMIGLTTGAILNMIGDPIFMFVLGMGTVGAGLSTAVSQFISFLILFYMFSSKKTQSRFDVRKIAKDLSVWKNIITTGFPSLVRQGLGSVSTMLLNTNAAIYGDAAVAAMSIVNRVTMFVFSLGLGIGQGFQPVAAFNYGAEKYSRVKKGFYFAVGMGEACIGVLSILGIVFAGRAIGIFRDDPEVIAIGVFALQCQCFACLFQPMNICTNMMFQSVGKNAQATWLSTLRSGACFIPMILILPRMFGLLGIQIAQTVADLMAFALTVPLMVVFLKNLPEDAVAVDDGTSNED